MSSLDYNKLKDAVYDNMLIYDADADIGKLTPRLVILMNQVAATYNGSFDNPKPQGRHIVKLFIDKDIIRDEIEEDDSENKWVENYNDFIYGFRYNELTKADFDYYINVLGATIQQNDTKLVVGELTDGSYILGSC